MTLRWYTTVIEASEPRRLADFWRQAPGWDLHFDLDPTDQTAEVERLLALGATRVDIGQRNTEWVVLADPEGNEFCVLSSGPFPLSMPGGSVATGPATTTGEEPVMASANPYLNFAGSCMEAFDFYRSVFGGEYTNVSKFSDMPSEAASDVSHAAADGIMHISLPIGDSILMGSDVPPGMGTVIPGNTCYVCVSPDSPEDAKRVFDGLSEGGEVEMPFDKQFWGDYFGSCTDKYGIKWMVDVAVPEAEQQSA